MSDLYQQVVVFHCIVIFAEQVLQLEAVILLHIETFVFDFPPASAIDDQLCAISLGNGQISDKYEGVLHVALGIFDNIQCM